ncbi:MAG: hypothetical protein KDA44_15090 [Planctomycetales bacterium]|nr:hypothetical protein [Planctomycetales bacterium]
MLSTTALAIACHGAWRQTAAAGERANNTSIAPEFAEARRTHKPIQRTDPVSVTVHEQLVAKTKQGQIDVYFEGDSITRRWGATDYPDYLAHWKKNFLGWNAANFAWGGDNTHNILWRLRNGELDGVHPKVIVLQAGTNNLPWVGPAKETTVEDVVTGVKAIIFEFRSRVPDATIILTGVFSRPQNPALAPAIREINKRLAALADGEAIRFININESLVDADEKARPGVFSDEGLHLAVAGYEAWAKALKPLLQELLGPPAKQDTAPPPTGIPKKKHAASQT